MAYITKDNNLLLVLLAIGLLVCAAQCQLDLASLSASNYTLQGVSNYTFNFFRYSTNTVPLGSSLILTFDQSYSGLIPSPACSSTSFSNNLLNCSFLGNTLTISNLFNNSNTTNLKSFAISIAGITNPSPAKNYVPVNYFQIVTTAGIMVQNGSSGQSITITPLAAQCSINILSGVVFSSASLTINYSSSYIIGTSNSSYYLNVAVPTYYPDDSTQTLLNPSFSNVVALQPSSSQNVYTIQYATSQTLTLLMPPSTKPQTNIITVTSYDINNSGTVDSCSISLDNVQPNTFSRTTISQQRVQSYSSVQFYLRLSTPLTNFDKLQLNFSNAFDISKINATSLSMAGYNNFGLTSFSDSYGKIIVLTASLTQPVINAQLIFTVPTLGLPFTTASQQIGIELLTSDSFLRIKQTNSYSATPGPLALNASCLSLQIGVSTSCLFTLNTSSYLSSNFTVQIALPNDFQVRNGSSDCAVNGRGLNSIAMCLYSATTNTITVVNLNSTTDSVAPLSFTVNINLTMSQKVSNYEIAITTLSAGQAVDSGSLAISTQQRILKSTQFSIVSSQVKTYSPTLYTMSLSLPFDLGYVYTLILSMPVDAQEGLTPTITNTNSQSHQNSTFNATVSNLLNATFQIQNLTTPISTQPVTFTIEIQYLGIVQFKGSQTIVNTVLKQMTTLSILQSNQIVFKQFVATLTVSGLAVSDYVRISANFTPFYDTDQTACSTAVVNCLPGGVVVVRQVNAGVAVFNVSLINLGYVGNYAVQVSVYDSLNLYGKQADSINLKTTTTNSLTVVGSQTNPYLNQTSTYTFNLTFTTPNATSLSCIVSSFTSITAQCNRNCGNPVFLGGSYIFTLSSTWAVIQFTVTNPINFNSSTKFTFLTGSPEKDYGQYLPQLVCSGTCRSCQTVNSSLCTSCYSWSANPLLWNKSCIAGCPAATYQTAGQCLNCSNVCRSCFGTSTNCSECINSYFLLNFTCLSACPSNSYLDPNTSTCIICQPPCSTCSGSTTACTSCLSMLNGIAYFYLLGQCYAQQCPITYFAAITNNTCLQCPTSCYACNSSSCLSCPPGNYLYKGACYQTCPNGSYTFNSSTCDQCIAPCFLCSSAQICSSCVTAYSLFNTSCISQCPDGFYSISGTCLKCNPTCQLCNATGCITCSDSSNYLYLQNCLSTCPTTIHPNNRSMVCQRCLSPCKDCTWSDTCLSCAADFSLMNTSCLSICPQGFYSDGSICQLCPASCISCSSLNKSPVCSTCVNGSYIYSWQCISQCPNDTTISGSYCVSVNCSDIDGCLSCSGYRCLQCNSLYQLNSNYACTYNLNSSEVLSALSRVPVPFPFLIAMLVIIVLAFFLKHNYQKMFAPLFIYSVGGVLEELCLILWTVLTLLWNANVTYPLPLVSVVYGTVLILAGYCLMNIIQLFLWACRISSDRKYKQWQLQDNRCASKTIWLLSLILSFRLDTIKFSRTAHSERLSARLQSPQKFKHYTVLAILGIIINLCSILVAAYVFYLQSTMNYLFFSCLEVAIMSVLMIIFSIAMLCVPAKQLIETKNDYKFGQDQAELQGPSLHQVLGVIGEEEHVYNNQICSESGSAVVAKNQFNPSQYQDLHQPSDFGHSSQKLTDQMDVAFREEEGEQATQMKIQKHSKKTDQEHIFQLQSQSESNHIILDEFQANNQQIINKKSLYPNIQQKQQKLYNKPAPKTTNNQPNLPSQKESSSVQGDFQEFEINYQNSGWLFTNRQQNQEYNKHILDEAGSDKNDELNVIKTVDDHKLQGERVADVEQEIEDYQFYEGLVGENLVHQEQSQIQKIYEIQQLQENKNTLQVATKQLKDKQLISQKKQKQEEKISSRNSATSKIQPKEQINNESYKQTLKPTQSKYQLQVNNDREEIKAQMDNLRMLELNYQLMEQQHTLQAQRLAQIEAEENKLKQLQKEKERQSKERANMELEEKLTRTALLVYQINEKLSGKKGGGKKIAKNQHENKRIDKKSKGAESSKDEKLSQFKYVNQDEVNLSKDYTLRQIKVKPKPQSSTYRKKHLYEEKHQEIRQSESEEDQRKVQDQHPQKKIVVSKRKQQMQKVKNRQKGKNYSQSQNSLKELTQQDEQDEENIQKIQGLNELQVQPNQEEWKHIEQALGRITFNQYEGVLQMENQSDESDNKQEQHNQQAQNQRTERNKRQQEHQLNVSAGQDKARIQQSQITVFKHEIIRVQQSQKSMKSFSDESHWPVQPQLVQKIEWINQKADEYIRQPLSHKNQYIHEAASLQIYQEESQDSKTVPDILFEQHGEAFKEEQMRSTRTKIRKGRVNRRIIDLSPENK